MHVLMQGCEKVQSFLIRKRRKATVLAVAGIGILGVGAASALTLILKSGATTKTIVDNGVGDSNPDVGAVTFIGSVGNFTVNVSTSLSKPIEGGGGTAEMDLNSVDTSNSLGGTLEIKASDDGFGNYPPGFFGPPPGPTTQFAKVGGTIAGGGTAKFTSGVDNSNTLFGSNASLILLPGPTAAATYGPGDFSGHKSQDFVVANPFAITQTATIHHNGAGTTSFDLNTQVSPEASSLAMLLPGLAPLGFVVNRRRRARKA